MPGRNKKAKLRHERGVDVARAYEVWVGMRYRVRHPRGDNACYAGLSVDPRWDDFEAFLADMGVPPAGLSIDRIDSDKGYGPENCRWADATTQSRNRGMFVKMNAVKAEEVRRRYRSGGVTQQVLAREYGVTQKLISCIVREENWR